MDTILNRKKFIFRTLLGALIVLGFFIFGILAQAIGQLTEPIVVKNAIRGYEFDETLTVINTDYTEQAVHFNTEGDIEGWATFYDPDEPATATDIILIPARTTKEVTAHFKVPDDAANGEYAGLVNVEIQPDENSVSSDTSVNLRQSIGRQVDITVTDQEDINLDVSIIPIEYSIPAGEPLDVKIVYYNRGNVVVKPDVEIRVYQKINDEEVVYYHVIHPYPDNMDGARPQAEQEIPVISIPVSPDVKAGNALAEFTFHVNNEEVYNETIKFSTGITAGTDSAGDSQAKPASRLGAVYLAIIALFVILAITAVIMLRNKKGKTPVPAATADDKKPAGKTNGVRKTTNGIKRTRSNGSAKTVKKAKKDDETK